MQQIIWDCHDIYHRVAFALPKHSESQGFGDRSTGARPEAHTLRRRNGAGVPDGRAVDRRRGGVRCDERGGGGDAPHTLGRRTREPNESGRPVSKASGKRTGKNSLWIWGTGGTGTQAHTSGERPRHRRRHSGEGIAGGGQQRWDRCDARR